ncbi:MAG: hypothetical protein KDK45_24700, partial [Leptospiraceae bacterium]|nr:hypothetical protein [Leptospiraceae bacterium]
VYLNNGKTMEGIDEFIKEKIYRYFDSYFEALPAITNISALKLKLNTEKSGIQTREMPNFLLKFGIKTEALALKKEKFPPENLFKELMLSGDVTVKSLLEKKQAELKGDLYSLEQKKKDEVYFQFLEKMSAFLKQNPHMKDFVIMDRLGIKSGQIHINAGDWTVEKPQTTHSKNYSLKKLPKIIE